MFRFLAPVLVFSFLVGCRSKDEAVSLVLSESIVRIASNGRYIGGIDTLNIASGIVAWGRKYFSIHRLNEGRRARRSIHVSIAHRFFKGVDRLPR